MSCSMKKGKPQNKCGPISIMRIIHNHMLKVVGNLNYVNDKSQLQILNFIIHELWNHNWNTCQSQYIVVFPPALVEFPAIWSSAKSCRLLLLLMPVMVGIYDYEKPVQKILFLICKVQAYITHRILSTS
jgi:hypothetical protein